MASKFIYMDCGFSGVSGDLLVCSIASLIGKDCMNNYISHILRSIPQGKNLSVELKQKNNRGISGLSIKLKDINNNHLKEVHFERIDSQKDSHNQFDGDAHSQNHDSTPSHHYSIKKMREDLFTALNIKPFPEVAVETAIKMLDIIIQAEAHVHGIPLENVHLHEIGSVDTIIDIAGVIFGLNELGVFDPNNPTALYSSPIAVGGGKIKSAHGILPVPAPATLNILVNHNLPYKSGPENYELATPTGVAILAALKDNGFLIFSKPEGELRTNNIGVGVGNLILDYQSNVLQIQYGEYIVSKNIMGFKIPVFILRTNVDDVRGEILGNLIEKIMDAGAFDIYVISTITKKNRPGFLISVICDEVHIQKLSEILMRETGTIGIRIERQERICLDREIIEKKITIQDQDFLIHLKISKDHNGNIIQEKIEFDDLKKISNVTSLTPREIEQKIYQLFIK